MPLGNKKLVVLRVEKFEHFKIWIHNFQYTFNEKFLYLDHKGTC